MTSAIFPRRRKQWGLCAELPAFVHFFLSRARNEKGLRHAPLNPPRGRLCSDPIYPLVPLASFFPSQLLIRVLFTAGWNLSLTTPLPLPLGPSSRWRGAGRERLGFLLGLGGATRRERPTGRVRASWLRGKGEGPHRGGRCLNLGSARCSLGYHRRRDEKGLVSAW